MKEYTKQLNKQESTNSDLEDRAAIFLEEMNISGDTMVQMNHHLDDIPKDKIRAYYLNDLMAGEIAVKMLKSLDSIFQREKQERSFSEESFKTSCTCCLYNSSNGILGCEN